MKDNNISFKENVYECLNILFTDLFILIHFFTFIDYFTYLSIYLFFVFIYFELCEYFQAILYSKQCCSQNENEVKKQQKI